MQNLKFNTLKLKNTIFIFLCGLSSVAYAQDENVKHWQWQEPQHDGAIDAQDVVDGFEIPEIDEFYDKFSH